MCVDNFVECTVRIFPDNQLVVGVVLPDCGFLGSGVLGGGASSSFLHKLSADWDSARRLCNMRVKNLVECAVHIDPLVVLQDLVLVDGNETRRTFFPEIAHESPPIVSANWWIRPSGRWLARSLYATAVHYPHYSKNQGPILFFFQNDALNEEVQRYIFPSEAHVVPYY